VPFETILDQLTLTPNIVFLFMHCIFYHFQLYALVIEVMDIILQKSFLHWILNPSTKQNNEEIIKSLISVDVCFNRRITRQRFKQAIDRCL